MFTTFTLVATVPSFTISISIPLLIRDAGVLIAYILRRRVDLLFVDYHTFTLRCCYYLLHCYSIVAIRCNSIPFYLVTFIRYLLVI